MLFLAFLSGNAHSALHFSFDGHCRLHLFSLPSLERMSNALFTIDTHFLAIYVSRCCYTPLAVPFRHRQAANYTLSLDGRRVAGTTRRAAESPPVKLQEEVGGGAVDVERVRREWEQWRLREETAFAKRLREKASLPGVVCVPRHSLYRGGTRVFFAHVVLRA